MDKEGYHRMAEGVKLNKVQITAHIHYLADNSVLSYCNRLPLFRGSHASVMRQSSARWKTVNIVNIYVHRV
jgi:hypothetical protein